ncbi:MAG TPA: site-specific integrase [Polyangiaceae bacterium]|jgi:integrase|nr:site-specific integrase [Polyangiaceae bacterium]
MSNSSSVTRGGVTYLVPEPTLRADEVIHSLRIGGSRYFFAERIPVENVDNDAPSQVRSSSGPGQWLRASKANDENRPSPPVTRAGIVSSEELAGMWATLDLADRDDLRVAALFILLCAGLRKSEIVALNFGDLVEERGTLQLRVRGTRANGQQERVISFDGDPKLDVLRRYLSAEHQDTQYLDAPLLWTLGRHGTCRRVRITTHALSYWVSQLQRRAGIERRLSPHAFRRAWLAAGLETG